MNSHFVLRIIDGAPDLLWATDLTKKEAPETFGAFGLRVAENSCIPKGFSRTLSWPNQAETAVRLFKLAWVHMAKALADKGYGRVTIRQTVKVG